MSDERQATATREPAAHGVSGLGVVSPQPALRIARQVASQVRQLHASDRLHGSITAASVSVDRSGSAKLTAREESPLVLGQAELMQRFPPAFHHLDEISLPESIAAARETFRNAGVRVDPRDVDLFQLGGLLCQLLTGGPVGEYLRSPRVKGQVPADCQELIDKALAFNGENRFADVAELEMRLAALDGGAELNAPAEAEADTSPSLPPQQSEPETSIDAHSRTDVPADEGELPFRTLGHFEVVERIGRGGMGDVYRGYEKSLDRSVAIKVLPADFGRLDEFVTRFYAEATAAARLIHPNVIQIHFIGEDGGRHFFAMQYVDGESLAELLKRRGRLGVPEALAIVEQALLGLSAAHERGMIHRDIKPGNILLDRNSKRALLADFGLVKFAEGASAMTATGVVMGTVDYISPEQGRGQAVDGRSDLYSIGVLMYRMLSGRLPFVADSPTAMIFQHVYETPLPLKEAAPEVPAVIAAIVEKLLAKDPDARYGTASDVLLDLKAFRENKALPSGADVVSLDGEDGSIVALEDAPQTVIVAAPSFADEPDIPADLDEAAPTGMWGRMRNRLIDAVEERAPEYVGYLQNTQQQVDHAVAVYERRERSLRKLVAEAESVTKELQQQADEWRTAGEAGEPAPQLAEIESQVAEQQEQLDAIRLRLSQASSRLEQLRSQRDVLNARLRVAEARVRVAGTAIGGHRRRSRIAVIAAGCAAVLALIAAPLWWFSGNTSPPDRIADVTRAFVNAADSKMSVPGETVPPTEEETVLPAERESLLPAVQYIVIAESGFNDDRGICSSSGPGSPFRIGGDLRGQGSGEPGWSGAWNGTRRKSLATIQTATTEEGDGAVYIRTDQANASRTFPSQSGIFVAEQHVRLPAGGRIVARVRDEAHGAFSKMGVGSQWGAVAGGHFEVLDGDGDGCRTGACPIEDTGLHCEPDRWHKVRVILDVAKQTYQFSVDDIPYNAPDPLGFRGKPNKLNEIHYATPSKAGAYLDTVTILTAQSTPDSTTSKQSLGTMPVQDPAITTEDGSHGDGGTIVKLPGPIDHVVVGAGGRLLILHLKKLQQLALFDVRQAKVIKYLQLPSNDVAYAAGAQKLFIGLRDTRVIQRWDLTTFERELTIAAPEGGIGSMAMGSESITPLILLASRQAKRSYLLDTASMKAEPLRWRGWKGGAWGPVHVHVSFDGSTAVACGGGWAGIEVATISDGRITSSQSGSYVRGDTLVAGNGTLVFPTNGGILRRDLASHVKGIEGTPFPAVGPSYSLAYFLEGGQPALTVFGNNDPKRIATIRDLPELKLKSSLAIQQRVHLIPRSKVLVTVGEGSDRLILRPFDLVQAMEDEGIDYLFVESAPRRRAERGKEYNYPIKVRSRKRMIKFSLQAAPEGMTISSDGVVTWNVPRKYEGSEAPVIVQVTDDSGQEIFHSFRVSIK